MRLTEKRGEVRRQRVRERFPLGRTLIRFEPVEILLEAVEAERTQTPREPAVRHVALVVRQRNARAAVDQLANAREIGRRELEVTSRVAGAACVGPLGPRLCARCHHACLSFPKTFPSRHRCRLRSLSTARHARQLPPRPRAPSSSIPVRRAARRPAPGLLRGFLRVLLPALLPIPTPVPPASPSSPLRFASPLPPSRPPSVPFS